jgi:hypothetical protein
MSHRTVWVNRPTGVYLRYVNSKVDYDGPPRVVHWKLRLRLPLRPPESFIWSEFKTFKLPLFNASIDFVVMKRTLDIHLSFLEFRLGWYPPWRLRLREFGNG